MLSEYESLYIKYEQLQKQRMVSSDNLIQKNLDGSAEKVKKAAMQMQLDEMAVTHAKEMSVLKS